MSDLLASKLYDSIAAANEPRIINNWHASSIAECPRAQYYARLKIPALTLPTAAKMLRWQAGHIIEEVVRPHLLGIYPDLISNQRLTSEELDLTGEYDNYSPSKKLLIEVKSVGPRAVRYRKKDEDRYHLRDDGPYLAHLYQNHAYVLLLRENNLPVERIKFLYVTLEGLLVSYDVSVDEVILKNVKTRLEVLKKAQAGTLPPCLCKEDHPLYKSSSQFCNYKGEDECCSTKLLKEANRVAANQSVGVEES